MKTSLLILVIIGVIGFAVIPYSYASCAAPLFGPPGPCFDNFRVSLTPYTEKSIMEDFTKRIESKYDNWQISDRNWSNVDEKLNLPAIICIEFVVDGVKHNEMAKWVDSHIISNFENHKDDSLCDKWFTPINGNYTGDEITDKGYLVEINYAKIWIGVLQIMLIVTVIGILSYLIYKRKRK